MDGRVMKLTKPKKFTVLSIVWIGFAMFAMFVVNDHAVGLVCIIMSDLTAEDG